MDGLEKIRRSVKPWNRHRMNFRNRGKSRDSEKMCSKKCAKRMAVRDIRRMPIIDDATMLDLLGHLVSVNEDNIFGSIVVVV